MVIRKIEGDCHTRKADWFAMTGKSTPRYRTTERYRAAQGRNDYTYLAHDLAARPAGKFQFLVFLSKPGACILFYHTLRPSYSFFRGRTVNFPFFPGTRKNLPHRTRLSGRFSLF